MSNKSGLGKLMLGLGIGVGAGMLLAPKKGEDLRKDLKNKIDELIEKAKQIDVKEVSDNFANKINDFKKEIEDLDKEKVLAIAKEKGEALKNKANDLVNLAKEKGTPVLEKTAADVRARAISVTKDVLRRLENNEKKQGNNNNKQLENKQPKEEA